MKRIQLYRYNYKKEFINDDGHQKSEIGRSSAQLSDAQVFDILDLLTFSGVIAQDLQRVLPDAVVQSGDTKLSSGELINNLLLVDKNRLNMECVGALKALGNKTENLDQKIVKLEEFIEKSAVINRAESSKGPLDPVSSQVDSVPVDKRPPARGLAALSK